ncbi:hypothetical protein EG68_04194 [Paragonimus skrjabini miyazakii]|uniref:C3H1-type domain-containing protein n=1 Tax=Paragonimus skrjabini miyazakii TaxID=59628 RepID=A0A8S9YYY1_9TREM|nr:hypothetical protein EG68_04194 [Paragonimus skrjabini miyazakii]
MGMKEVFEENSLNEKLDLQIRTAASPLFDFKPSSTSTDFHTPCDASTPQFSHQNTAIQTALFRLLGRIKPEGCCSSSLSGSQKTVMSTVDTIFMELHPGQHKNRYQGLPSNTGFENLLRHNHRFPTFLPDCSVMQHRKSFDDRRYKTELCNRYMTNFVEGCVYGSRCRFAHGLTELRISFQHVRYKTELCFGFHKLGHCAYGRRCTFIHDESVEKLSAIRLLNRLLQTYRQMHPNSSEICFIDLIEFGLVLPGSVNHRYLPNELTYPYDSRRAEDVLTSPFMKLLCLVWNEHFDLR